jgi:hypothetical protein
MLKQMVVSNLQSFISAKKIIIKKKTKTKQQQKKQQKNKNNNKKWDRISQVLGAEYFENNVHCTNVSEIVSEIFSNDMLQCLLY